MTGEHTYCFIINCASNSFKAESFFKEKEHILAQTFDEVEFIYIRKEDSIADIVHEKAKFFTHIIACGGDGTVNQAVNGIMGSDAILGVIPLGSGNDFAKSIGLRGEFENDLSILSYGKVRNTDVISYGNSYFINTFGIGVDGLTNYFASKSKLKTGFLKYFIGGLRALFSSNPFHIELKIDGVRIDYPQKCWMIAVANGKSEGGKYKISPDSLNYDGRVEVILVKAVPRFRLIWAFLKLSVGFGFREDLVTQFSVKESCSIEMKTDLKCHADGEQVSPGKSIHCKLIKGAIPVIVNQ